MKHPDALPPPPHEFPLAFEKQQESEKSQNLLQWFYWMHNARGSFNNADNDSNFLRKIASNDIVYKEDFSNEVHSFFKQMFPTNDNRGDEGALVSISFFGCFLLVII